MRDCRRKVPGVGNLDARRSCHHMPCHAAGAVRTSIRPVTACKVVAAASTARALVRNHAAAASPALAAVAAIGRDRSSGHQPGAYAVHPAVLDATTHTAAVLSGSQSPATEDQAAVTRIPAALDAFAAQTAGPGQAAGSGKWCCGALDALRPDGSVVTNFGLGAGAAHLAGFTAKVCKWHMSYTSCSMANPDAAHSKGNDVKLDVILRYYESLIDAS